jgi:hypothetical protein
VGTQADLIADGARQVGDRQADPERVGVTRGLKAMEYAAAQSRNKKNEKKNLFVTP